MKRDKSLNILLTAGATALLGAVISAFIGLYMFDRDMIGNLLAEVTGVLLEVSLVLLVIDRLIKRNQRKDWSFAYTVISKRFAVVFVDIMRLLYTKSLPETNDRYNDFIDVGFQHLNDLRSHIEGFAIAFEPEVHQQCRQIEQQFIGMLGRIKRDEKKYSGLKEFSAMRDLARLLDSFLETSRDPIYEQTKLSAEKTLKKFDQTFVKDLNSLDLKKVLSIRLQAQSELLSLINSDQRLSSIIDDYEMNLSLPYFTLDFLILEKLPETILHS